jgi:hypothetical protein
VDLGEQPIARAGLAGDRGPQQALEERRIGLRNRGPEYGDGGVRQRRGLIDSLCGGHIGGPADLLDGGDRHRRAHRSSCSRALCS